MKNVLKSISIASLVLIFSFTAADKKTIVIDAGHGGVDKGTKKGEIVESEIVLQLAKKIQAANPNPNVRIVLSRDSDAFKSLQERAWYINSLAPEFVISLHLNASNNKKQKGIEIFTSEKNKVADKSMALAQKLENSLKFQIKNRTIEKKQAPFHLLRNVEYPVALVELGFLTNEEDASFLLSEKGQQQIVSAILELIK